MNWKHQIVIWLTANFLRIFRPKMRPALRVETQVTPVELFTLAKLASKAGSCLEIGSYLGASALAITSGYKSGWSGRLTCIDTFQNDAMSEGNRPTREIFDRNTASIPPSQLEVIEGRSEVVCEFLRETGRKFDFVFFDGDHSIQGVQRDWNGVKDLLAPRAVVAFHDAGWAPGVQTLIKNNLTGTVSRLGALPNLWWGRLDE